jgi:NTP pyrophosphatase (non-canonical NTP hydrolase)
VTETQKTITDWQREVFGPPADGAHLVGRALLEFAELLGVLGYGITATDLCWVAEMVLARGTNKVDGPAAVDRDALADELADVAIVLAGTASAFGIDLQAAVDLKMAENRGRRWKADGRGTGKHVEGEQQTQEGKQP